MRIDSSGNVGIGTSSPASVLHAVGFIKSGLVNNSDNAKIGGIALYGATTSVSRRSWAILPESALPGTLGFWVSSANNTEPTSGTQVVSINSSGNVGLGTSNPTFKLDAHGGVDTTFTNLPTNLRLANNGTIAAGLGAGISFAANYDNTNLTTYAVISGIRENATVSNTAGALVFGTRDSGGGVSIERMRIDSSGRLLVGRTSTAGSNAPIVSEGGITVTAAKGVSQEFVAGTTGSASTITITFDGNDSSSTAIVEILMYGYNNKYLDYVAGIYATQADQVLRNVNDGTTSVALSGAAGSSWTATISTAITNPVVKVKATVGGRASAFSTAPTITFA
jgi:hypothetical protein